ncbi:MAG: hypothetical protein PWQ20_1598 [Thermotogaceae bacterium]|jgi:drug/metabolite transporter (DMT)-like permease|nr:hypothetical protein [Thermotogaceae bacterium]MDN5338528.1 hypothetical protein [Thermotogaceae bacterium]
MRKKAVFWLLAITIVWGSTFPLQKIALVDVSPLVYISLRFWIAFLFSFFLWKKRNFKYAFILGLVLSIGYITQTWGLKLTTASKSGFITSLYIPLVPFFSYMFEREKVTKLQFLGFVLSMIGFYMISGGIDGINVGDFLTLICAVSFALHIVLITVYSKKVEETSLLSYQFLTVAVINTLLSLNSNWNLTVMAVSVGIYTGIAASVLVILVQLKYQKIVGSNATALIFSGEPVFASIFSYYFLNERLSEFQFAGAVLLIIAVILASLKRSDEI